MFSDLDSAKIRVNGLNKTRRLGKDSTKTRQIQKQKQKNKKKIIVNSVHKKYGPATGEFQGWVLGQYSPRPRLAKTCNS